MKNILSRIYLLTCISILFLVFIGFSVLSPPPPPPGTESQHSESGNITEGTPPGSGNDFWVNTNQYANLACFTVLDQSYIILDRTFTIKSNNFTGTDLDVDVRFVDALGNPVYANFLGQVDHQFSATVDLLTLNSNLEVIPCIGGRSNENCFHIRFYLTCNVPANFPYARDVFMQVNFSETSTHLMLGTGDTVTVVHTEEDFEVKLTACVPYAPSLPGSKVKRLARNQSLQGLFSYSLSLIHISEPTRPY